MCCVRGPASRKRPSTHLSPVPLRAWLGSHTPCGPAAPKPHSSQAPQPCSPTALQGFLHSFISGLLCACLCQCFEYTQAFLRAGLHMGHRVRQPCGSDSSVPASLPPFLANLRSSAQSRLPTALASEHTHTRHSPPASQYSGLGRIPGFTQRGFLLCKWRIGVAALAT